MNLLLLLLLFIGEVITLELRECNRALGMESRSIKDQQITASSSFDKDSTGPQHARLGSTSGSGAWCPYPQINSTTIEWIEIDLKDTMILTGVKTQGRYDHGRGNEFARFYRLEYWRSSVGEWRQLIRENGNIVIEGNTDTRSAVPYHHDGGVVVEKVRIYPLSNTTRTICMRLELYGCPYNDVISSYSMRDGDELDGLNLRDTRFDGRHDEDNQLSYGLGKLYDGLIGYEDHEIHPQRWIGWRSRKDIDYVEITVYMKRTVNISAILLHTSNYRRYNAQVFTSISVEFSKNGKDFSSRSIEFPYQSDLFENLRWVRLTIPNREAKIIRLRLTLPPFPHWLLLSEVRFEIDGQSFSLPSSSSFHPISDIIYSTPSSSSTSSSFLSPILIVSSFFIIIFICIVGGLYRARTYAKRADSLFDGSSSSKDMFSYLENGTMKTTIVSPSTYAMTRDNRHNEIIEKIPLNDDDNGTIYADPDSLEDDSLSSSLLYKAPLLCSSTNTTLSIGRGTLKTKGMSESVYSTLLPSISRSQLEIIRPIGQGEFGKVHLARLERRRFVAVKSLHKRDEQSEKAFEREVRMLGALRHNNVVEVIGVVLSEGDLPPACVMQYMANGDLKKYLRTHSIDRPTALSMCTQIAAGMSYLESQCFVHRDVAARNCLLDDEYCVKISDFGMARSLYSEDYYCVEGEHRMPVRWMSPEALLLGKFSSSSDVWAYAVTVWEVLTGCSSLPYSSLSHEQVVDRLSKGEGLHFDCPPLCPEWLYHELLIPCWNNDPSLRPTFQAIHHYLQSAQHKYRT